MTEYERERIKLRASYLNGLAIAFAAIGMIGPLYAMILQELSLGRFAIGVLIAAGAGISSWEIHEIATRTLKRLDND